MSTWAELHTWSMIVLRLGHLFIQLQKSFEGFSLTNKKLCVFVLLIACFWFAFTDRTKIKNPNKTLIPPWKQTTIKFCSINQKLPLSYSWTFKMAKKDSESEKKVEDALMMITFLLRKKYENILIWVFSWMK